jgi:hypothetical protein
MGIDEFSALPGRIRGVVDRLPKDAEKLGDGEQKKLRADLERLEEYVQSWIEHLDRIRAPAGYFDPSDPQLYGITAAVALVGQPKLPLSEATAQSFLGSGVYALYYRGAFDVYRPLAATEHPIYVGKADPAKGTARSSREQGDRLAKRLSEHRRSIERAASTLSVTDFDYRYLTVATGHQTAAESALIQLFRPIWNSETKLLFGIGKHGDSATTRGNKRSPWDVLHPGRQWAADTALEDSKSLESIRHELILHFENYPVLRDTQTIVQRLMDRVAR